MSFTVGSLFDGSGGFPLSAFMCGGVPLWASEIEPYPIAVTRSRFPHMKHIGDVVGVRGDLIEPVDVITFGSPCQDLSVAGQRKGLKHEDNGDDETTRSGLFMEAIRIIKEMREATDGVYPTFALWENVPGAFTSNRGEDFKIVLEELVKIVEPTATMPTVPKNGWPYADSYVGDGWSLAYRVFNAQYWGVPQRRVRVFAVLDLGGERARKILFERESLRGYFEEGRTPWKRAETDNERGVISADCERDCLVYDARGNGDGKTVNTLIGDHENRVTDYTTIVLDRAFYNQGENALYEPQYYVDGPVPPIVARGPSAVIYYEEPRYIVRRLTPNECCRLQGFPDDWGVPDKKTSLTADEYHFWCDVRKTHDRINNRKTKDYTEKQILTWYNKLHTDSAEYKMWGNGIALPNALYVMQGISDEFI